MSRESSIVQRSETLRRGRKSLLSELSALVKTAKRLQECQRGTLQPPENANDIIDEMILKACKIVTKGVRFLDFLEVDRRARAPAAVTVMATVAEESYIPPTPPADRTTFGHQRHESASETGSRATTDDMSGSIATLGPSETRHGAGTPWNSRMSSLNTSVNSAPPTNANEHRLSQGSMKQANRLSSGMAHRVSLAGPSPLSRPQHLVSERLNRSHDKLLSHLGSFIGRLHLQSHSRPELAFAIKQSATSGGELLAVIDSVCAYSTSSSAGLSIVRVAMFERIQVLVFSARDTLINAATEGADIIMPQDNSILLMAATGCVRAAGECVARTKAAIERVGDFEFELEENTLGIDLSILDVVVEEQARTQPVTHRPDVVSNVAESFQPSESAAAPILRRPGRVDKPLPRVPRITIPTEPRQSTSPASSRPASLNDDNASSVASSVSSIRPTLPPLPELCTALHHPLDHGVNDSSRIESDLHSCRFDALVASSAGSSATFLSRDSETSIVSQSSTRATTPDHAMVPRNQPSMSELSSTGSFPQAEEADDVETRLLERTYAHELMFNKEGQVTGGSLPALVERLTTYESTPDAAFVSTFYLTFRLFCTPAKLTEALIDRFDYVAESPHMSAPVRLRVYNAFKGWLESHWRDQTDREALKLIMPFAEVKLGSVLPSAGRRLLELAKRVSGEGSLVPRLVSSMGKTSTAIAHCVPADTPMPHPAISKSQQNLLSSFKVGGGHVPTILDFEPLELARQLTMKQMSIFCSILPEELLASQWMKNGGVDAPHVKAMSSLSTDLSNLVAETILQYSEIKKRAAVIKQWIKVAHQCHEIHNYDGLMAIICSLNSSTISRLRKTWDAISIKRKEMLAKLQEIVEPSQNNKVLRTRLHDHVSPCLPFLGMYLTDLTFVDIGNPATKQVSLGTQSEDDAGGLTVVNFDKHSRTAKIIGELQRFQIPYRLVEVPDMQDWLAAQIRRVRDGDHGNVQVTYYRKSLLLEPRETGPRRDLEPPTPTASGAGTSRPDLFAWMSRDRGGPTPTPAQG